MTIIHAIIYFVLFDTLRNVWNKRMPPGDNRNVRNNRMPPGDNRNVRNNRMPPGDNRNDSYIVCFYQSEKSLIFFPPDLVKHRLQCIEG